ncbi:hypothetical protein LDENG_00131980, partial [Lucifuga dentata]
MKIEYIRLKHAKWPVWSFKAHINFVKLEIPVLECLLSNCTFILLQGFDYPSDVIMHNIEIISSLLVEGFMYASDVIMHNIEIISSLLVEGFMYAFTHMHTHA